MSLEFCYRAEVAARARGEEVNERHTACRLAHRRWVATPLSSVADLVTA
jgi:hypothetical protein